MKIRNLKKKSNSRVSVCRERVVDAFLCLVTSCIFCIFFFMGVGVVVQLQVCPLLKNNIAFHDTTFKQNIKRYAACFTILHHYPVYMYTEEKQAIMKRAVYMSSNCKQIRLFIILTSVNNYK